MQNNIKLARKREGLTQAELATLAGVTANYISIIESGRKEPSLRTLSKIAKALKVSTASLLDTNLDKDLEELKKRYKVEELKRGIEKLIQTLT